MNQVERIKKMEGLLDEAKSVFQDLEKSLERYESIRKDLRTLDRYFSSEQWMKDYTADEEGRLPKDLKRGILSEDALYDLFEQEREIALSCLNVAGTFLQG